MHFKVIMHHDFLKGKKAENTSLIINDTVAFFSTQFSLARIQDAVKKDANNQRGEWCNPEPKSSSENENGEEFTVLECSSPAINKSRDLTKKYLDIFLMPSEINLRKLD